MNKKKTIAVVGGGSWATANVKILTDNDTEKEICWWMRSETAPTSPPPVWEPAIR